MWLRAIFPQQNIAMNVLFSISQFAKIEMNNIFQFQCKEENILINLIFEILRDSVTG